MVYLEKSQPSPDCLAKEAQKAHGDYKCDPVLNRLVADFKNKCYLCEGKVLSTMNVEHFKPHRGDKRLKFSWDNLFLACGHCNNTKSDRFGNILNCTVLSDHVETRLKYTIQPFPADTVHIDPLSDDERVLETQQLLIAIYNGTTPLKRLEAHNLRLALIKEVVDFQWNLEAYFDDTNNEADRSYYREKIEQQLSRAAPFTAFKRWIVRDSAKYLEAFRHALAD